MLMLLALAALIPPPPDWEPPSASGPGTFCGRTFTIEVRGGERIWQEWPGEMALRDVYGTYHLETPHGEVVLSEVGERAKPQGSAMPVPPQPGVPFSSYGDRVYAVSTNDGGVVTAMTVRFGEEYPAAGHLNLLSRVRRDRSPQTACLAPDNR